MIFDGGMTPRIGESLGADKTVVPHGCEQTAHHSTTKVGQSQNRNDLRSHNVLSKSQPQDSSLWSEPSRHGGTSKKIRFYGSLMGTRRSLALMNDVTYIYPTDSVTRPIGQILNPQHSKEEQLRATVLLFILQVWTANANSKDSVCLFCLFLLSNDPHWHSRH